MPFKKGHKHFVGTGGSKKKIRPYRNGVDKNIKPERTYQQGFLSRLDGRTEIFSNLDKTYRAIIADLGGWESTSRIERSLVERYVFCEFQVRKLEVRMSEDGNGNTEKLMEQWSHLNNAINSIAGKLGTTIRKAGKSELKKYIKEKSE